MLLHRGEALLRVLQMCLYNEATQSGTDKETVVMSEIVTFVAYLEKASNSVSKFLISEECIKLISKFFCSGSNFLNKSVVECLLMLRLALLGRQFVVCWHRIVQNLLTLWIFFPVEPFRDGFGGRLVVFFGVVLLWLTLQSHVENELLVELLVMQNTIKRIRWIKSALWSRAVVSRIAQTTHRLLHWRGFFFDTRHFPSLRNLAFLASSIIGGLTLTFSLCEDFSCKKNRM